RFALNPHVHPFHFKSSRSRSFARSGSTDVYRRLAAHDTGYLHRNGFGRHLFGKRQGKAGTAVSFFPFSVSLVSVVRHRVQCLANLELHWRPVIPVKCVGWTVLGVRCMRGRLGALEVTATSGESIVFF
uniref:Uncharacterized protein n=1 Tax=Anopheles atroparvus TaxID=41427 RepID=A0AAG5D4W4_ANOAO